MSISDQDKAGLSAEEIAALEEGEQDNEALQRIAGATEDKGAATEAGADVAGKKGEAADTAAAADTVAASGEDATGTEDAAAAAEDTAASRSSSDDLFVPVYTAAAPEDYDAKIADIKTKRGELLAQFKSGDIDVDVYQQKVEDLSEQALELRTARNKAEIAAEMAQQTAQQRWAWEVSRFMKDVLKADGVDYAGNNLLNAALDVAVKDLANDPKNADKSGEWFLEQAHVMVKEQLGIGAKKAATPPGGEEKKDPVKEALAQRRNGAAAPKTLGGLPAAAEADVGQDEFAEVDKLAATDVIAYERALANMSPEQQARYLGSGG